MTRWTDAAGHPIDPPWWADAPAVDLDAQPYTMADLQRDVRATRKAYERVKAQYGEAVANATFRYAKECIKELSRQCQIVLPAANPAPTPQPAPPKSGRVTATRTTAAGGSRRAASAVASSSARLPGTGLTDRERRAGTGKRGR